MKIVILEAKSLGDDISFTSFEQFGEVKVYLQTTREQMAERIRDAQVIIVNKLPVCEETLKDAPLVELVCVTATGVNNLDGDYLKKRGIAAYNVAGYSTDAVAQHTFALLFYVLEKLRFYDEFVKSEDMRTAECFPIMRRNLLCCPEKHGGYWVWEPSAERLHRLPKLLDAV